MRLVEYSFVIILQKVKSVSGRACSFAHLKDFLGESGASPYISGELRDLCGHRGLQLGKAYVWLPGWRKEVRMKQKTRLDKQPTQWVSAQVYGWMDGK